MAANVPKVKGLNCPNCGAALEIRGFGHTLSVVCPQCLSILDAKDPNLQILQRFEDAVRVRPVIPLGTRGNFRGVLWEVIGFQVRTTHIEGVDYSWQEFLLFNPYHGFRYLTVYNGHWNYVETVRALPQVDARRRPVAVCQGVRFQHFQTADAATTFVLGEFPWQVQVGETVKVADFIAPPRMLSRESTAEESTWSLGEYVAPAEIWQAFKLPGKVPVPVGVFADQPAPPSQAGGLWAICLLLLAALFAMASITAGLATSQQVYDRYYRLDKTPLVTEYFDLKGHAKNVEVSVHTTARANAFFSFALINAQTGRAWDFGRNFSGYKDVAIVPAVPAGRYYLRVEADPEPGTPAMNYELKVRRGVPSTAFYWIAGFLILIPPAFKSMAAGNFEKRRWQESDYAG